MITFCIYATIQHSIIGLILVQRLQLASQQPHSRVKPPQAECHIDKHHIPRVAQAYMSQLVRENHPAKLLHIALRGNNMAKPTKRRGEIIYDREGYILLDNAHLTAMNQAPHRVDTHSQTCQHKSHANKENHYGQILQQRHVINAQSHVRDIGHDHIINLDRGEGWCGVVLLDNLHTAQRQQSRQQYRAEQQHTIEVVQRLVAHRYLIYKIERRQAQRRLTEIYYEVKHSLMIFFDFARCYWLFTLRISSSNSSTEIFSSAINAETTRLYELSK